MPFHPTIGSVALMLFYNKPPMHHDMIPLGDSHKLLLRSRKLVKKVTLLHYNGNKRNPLFPLILVPP